jgi:hypothetical protein
MAAYLRLDRVGFSHPAESRADVKEFQAKATSPGWPQTTKSGLEAAFAAHLRFVAGWISRKRAGAR